MKKPEKTNASRLLDAAKIPYELLEYEVDETDLSATTLAAKLGQNVRQVFKTLVLRGNASGVFVCVVPGDAEVDLKLAAKASGNKNAEMVAMKELQPLTGYIRGGCSPLGLKKPFPIYIDETCREFGYLLISAGRRGLQLKLSPDDLVRVTRAQVCHLCL